MSPTDQIVIWNIFDGRKHILTPEQANRVLDLGNPPCQNEAHHVFPWFGGCWIDFCIRFHSSEGGGSERSLIERS